MARTKEGRGSEPRTLTWEGELTLERVGELKAQLLEVMDARREILLSLAGVSAVDASALQLLCSAHREALSMGRSLALVGGRPASLEAAIASAGFSRSKGCDETCLWREASSG